MFEWLQSDPKGFLLFMLYRAPAVLFAISMHEFAHGFAAYKSGDPTAKIHGRLSLNPIKHMDALGTLFLFLFGFGWAKPVPVNPNNFRNKKRDDIIVSLAGITVNFVLFFISMLLSVLIGKALYQNPFDSNEVYNFFLNAQNDGFFVQLMPDYHNVLEPMLKTPWLLHIQRVLLHSVLINIGLCLFNLLPLPPLDGFHVLNQLVFKGKIYLGGQLFRFFQGALFALMFFTDFISKAISQAMYFVQGNVLWLLLKIFGI
ncbi:MAG: site-2 protease family protein [Eubacteriales bacterium]|nr:site-2 protease family protein [Eubacteriales bacterium]